MQFVQITALERWTATSRIRGRVLVAQAVFGERAEAIEKRDVSGQALRAEPSYHGVQRAARPVVTFGSGVRGHPKQNPLF